MYSITGCTHRFSFLKVVNKTLNLQTLMILFIRQSFNNPCSIYLCPYKVINCIICAKIIQLSPLSNGNCTEDLDSFLVGLHHQSKTTSNLIQPMSTVTHQKNFILMSQITISYNISFTMNLMIASVSRKGARKQYFEVTCLQLCKQ